LTQEEKLKDWQYDGTSSYNRIF